MKPDLKVIELPLSEDPFLNRLHQLIKDISIPGNEYYCLILVYTVLDYFKDIDTYEADLIEQYLTIAVHFMELHYNNLDEIE